MSNTIYSDELHRNSSPLEVFIAFLRLGLTSFGGPIAHIAYFHREFVERRKWISESGFAQLLALCQFLPGPASSQLGFSLGLFRGGWLGAFAAFLGFTLPSAILLFAFAMVLPQLSNSEGEAAVHGLKLVALAVVSHGLINMARKLCDNVPRAAIGTAAAVVLLCSEPAWMQLIVVALGGLAGWCVCRDAKSVHEVELPLRYGAKAGWVLLASFAGLLVASFHLVSFAGLVEVGAVFYQAGALVFGGGHVVLPLLEEATVGRGWLTADEFIAGYGAAQAIPGPMFTFSAYLGASVSDSGGLSGAGVALVAIFLPGFLFASGALPLWKLIAERQWAARIVAGISAAVVGLLGAALYDPVWTSAVRGPVDVAIALVGFVLLAKGRAPAIVVVGWCVGASVFCASPWGQWIVAS